MVVAVGALAQAPAPQAKDQAEVDLFTQSSPQTNPDATKRLAALNTWKEKYPDTALKLQRALLFAITYQALNQPAKMYEAAKEVLAIDPKEVNALGWVTALVPVLPPTPDTLSNGEKAAKGLIDADKPEGVADAQWKTMKDAMTTTAHKTLGFVATQRNQPDVAEQEYGKTLQGDPTQAQVAYDLGRSILAQKKTERYTEALFYIARAASLGGPGALPPALQKQVDAYLIKSYAAYHGQDDAGLKELRQLAVSQPMPPAGFKIKNINEIDAEKAEQFAKANPQLALWKAIKDSLTSAGGDQYWETTFKGSGAPKFSAKLISMKPALRPKELMLSMEGNDTADVTLKFETALPGKADPGTTIEFEGIPSAFTKDPFMVTFDVESKDKISGWPAQAAPAPVRRPVAKKAPAKK
jgi:tetratricopeptide (TPR) repeat protein